MTSDLIPQHPLNCEWCTHPATHLAVIDLTGGERQTPALCGPCAHSVTILPSSWEHWWLFRLVSDGRVYEKDCAALAMAAEEEFSG